MTSRDRTILTINGGSSTVKCALFTADREPRAIVRETIQSPAASGLPLVMEWIRAHTGNQQPAAIGHRIVHGGPVYQEPQRITDEVVATLTRLIPFAPNHLPDEIALIEAFGRARPGTPQVACFDTAFHRDLPEVARRLPIPRLYDSKGIRRYGFHGLSFAFLMRELERLGGTSAARGRVILAHLGNGSSLAAVSNGQSIDTTMGLTPIGGVPTSTRSGDLDPGVVTWIERSEGMGPDRLEDLLSRTSGLAGISGSTGDMRDLLARSPDDAACRLAVDVYTYQIRKAIGAFAAALGGLDTLVFSGGIGEHAAEVRARICDGLQFLGVELDSPRNTRHAPIVSTPQARVVVRVVPTDEEVMIATSTAALVL